MADKKLTPKQKKMVEDLFKKKRKENEKKREDKLRKFFEKKREGKPSPMPMPMPKDKFQRRYGEVPKMPRKKKKDGVISFKELERMKKRKPKVMEAKKGGSAKFPDLSGDGKVTQKDILIGRGVIKRKNGGAAGRPKKKRSLKDTVKNVIEGFKKKPKVFGDIIKTGPRIIPRPKNPKPRDPNKPNIIPRPKNPKPRDPNKPRIMTPAKRKKTKMMATGGVAGRLAKRGYGKARS